MNLYEITLPIEDNQGASLKEAHAAFTARLLATFGGFTSHCVHGAWTDDEGRVYFDKSIAYRVAHLTDRRRSLGYMAKDLFPDQEAFFLAHLGEAHIVTRAAIK